MVWEFWEGTKRRRSSVPAALKVHYPVLVADPATFFQLETVMEKISISDLIISNVTIKIL